MLYSSSNAPDLKARITRDRNFKTPYFSNPYGYQSSVVDKTIAQGIQGIGNNSPVRMNSNSAFNSDTRSLISPFGGDSPVKAKRPVQNVSINMKLVNKSKNSGTKGPWSNAARSSLIRLKSKIPGKIHFSPKKKPRHSQSIDMGATKASGLNSTFTSGFNSTMASSDLMGRTLNSSFRDSSYSHRSGNSPYVRSYGKYKLKKTLPVYDFTGGDSPWINKSGVNNKVQGHEQNFKINYMNYDKEFNSARPVAYSKGRKYCDMTRFMKNLEDNRINQKWKMAAYRSTFG